MTDEKKENLFGEGADARQTASQTLPSNSPFRPRYRALSTEEVAQHDALKNQADALLAEIEKIRVMIEFDGEAAPDLKRASARSRCMALAVTKLEEAVMWAAKGLTG